MAEEQKKVRFVIERQDGPLTVTVVRIIAQVMNVNLGNSFLLSTAHDGVIEESFNHFRQYGYNVYSHLSAIVFCKSTNIFATFA